MVTLKDLQITLDTKLAPLHNTLDTVRKDLQNVRKDVQSIHSDLIEHDKRTEELVGHILKTMELEQKVERMRTNIREKLHVEV